MIYRSGYSATATQVSKMAAPGSLAVINYAIGPPRWAAVLAVHPWAPEPFASSLLG